ncbi:MAG: type ISP restriction/modification enzyme [bacterium]
MTAISEYLKQVEYALQAGSATEHTYRPALKAFIEAVAQENGLTITATNEPKRVKCGAPDFIVTKGQTPLGYIEAKDVDTQLTTVEKSEQMARYLDGLGNLILTDYLEFRWYAGGEKRMTVRLAYVGRNNKVIVDADGEARITELICEFLRENVPTINNPRDLATRMASLTHLLRDAMAIAYEEEGVRGGLLHDQLSSFREVLIHDLKPADFVDMYAQTLCYGLFTSRCSMPVNEEFTRRNSPHFLPKTNPFLRKMFSQIAGPELEDEPFVWVVDNLTNLLNRADIAAILTNFGKRTRQQDPVVHFYETFLAAYDPKLRETRGVYYTPEPVVSYIVRGVDHLLKTKFALPQGLADTSKVSKLDSDGLKHESHKVQILDPATGTGTFLHGVIDQIYQHLTEQGQIGMWNSYVAEHLLPRLFGFELLMAPYAVAHMKLGLQLSELGYDFHANERLRIYLTNTLQEAFELPPASGFTQWLNAEAAEANQVKQNLPILVILGNPPYSGHSANKGKWISDLLHGKDTMTGKATANYFKIDGNPLLEQNPKYLNDDYVKFMRFAQWRIDQTGYGILAFITNNGYLDNPTFKGMRHSLWHSFDEIYLLDLHGNSKKGEKTPDGGKDENVFDIQQGVSIGFFVKYPSPQKTNGTTARVFHTGYWGTRKSKYERLNNESISLSKWQELSPQAPYFFFVPLNTTLLPEYENGWEITDILCVNSTGIKTHRDDFVIDVSSTSLRKRIESFRDLNISDDVVACTFNLNNTRDWKISGNRKSLASDKNWESYFTQCLYRPFDKRFYYHHESVVELPRHEVMHHFMKGDNYGLVTTRQTRDTWGALATQSISDHKCCAAYDTNYLFPLYLYPNGKPKAGLFDLDTPSQAPGGRRPNLAAEFIADCAAKLHMNFVPDGKGDLQTTFGPEDIFSYMYAIFHAPTYRSRYEEFLKIDFPRLPITSNPVLFRNLCALGDELVRLHLMEQQAALTTRFRIAGSNVVGKVSFTCPHNEELGRVWINKTQYIDGVPAEVWEFYIGGYQVCDKWLKDRKGRELTFDDVINYQHIIAALAETKRIMQEIDDIIDANSGWPIR